jgi:hypothetical protein
MWLQVLEALVSYSVVPQRKFHLFELGEGVASHEWLLKTHCGHIPGCLDHLLNNIHHSFTWLPHILVPGRGPMTQEGLYDQ